MSIAGEVIARYFEQRNAMLGQDIAPSLIVERTLQAAMHA